MVYYYSNKIKLDYDAQYEIIMFTLLTFLLNGFVLVLKVHLPCKCWPRWPWLYDTQSCCVGLTD